MHFLVASNLTMNNRKILAIDVGNSYIKWQLEREPVATIAHSEFDPQIWDKLQVINQVLLSCVVTATAIKIQNYCKQRNIPLFIATVENFSSYRTEYKNRNNLGIDRYLASLKAYSDCNTNVIVIDAGTALTIDVVNAKGVHLGGYILPGANKMLDSLSSTDIANYDNAIAVSNNLGTDTNSCILNAINSIALAMVNFIIAKDSLANAKIYITGGGAGNLIKVFKADNKTISYSKTLVLDGLKQYYSLASSKGD